MVPYLDKNAIKVLTQNMNGEQAAYVAGISNIMNDIDTNNPKLAEHKDDIIYVIKIMAFADKFKVLHWAALNDAYHKRLDDFGNELESYKDAVAENIQAIIGQFDGTEFDKIELPLGNDPLVIINELKQCVFNWFELHKDDMEYEGCRNATSGFAETIKKYIYLFRLCK